MPDWFKHLTKDVIVFVTPFKHFGSGWGECVDNELQVHTTTKGQWNILITASRNDHCATMMCPQEVEYTTVPIIDDDEEKKKLIIEDDDKITPKPKATPKPKSTPKPKTTPKPKATPKPKSE